MDNDHMDILMNLCRELHLVMDLDPEEAIFYDPHLFEEMLYSFYLYSTQDPSLETLQFQCELLRNHFTLFILNLKQSCNLTSPCGATSITESITSLAQNLITFMENIAKNSNEDVLLQNLANILTSVSNANPYSSLRTHVAGSILKEKDHLHNILQDLIALPSTDLLHRSKDLISHEITLWEQIARKILEEEHKDCEILLKECKESCKSLSYLVACVFYS